MPPLRCRAHQGEVVWQLWRIDSFEQLGKPALVICTYPFEVTGRNIARALGIPDYPFAMVDHPIGSRTLDELKGRARSAYDQGVGILTGP